VFFSEVEQDCIIVDHPTYQKPMSQESKVIMSGDDGGNDDADWDLIDFNGLVAENETSTISG